MDKIRASAGIYCHVANVEVSVGGKQFRALPPEIALAEHAVVPDARIVSLECVPEPKCSHVLGVFVVEDAKRVDARPRVRVLANHEPLDIIGTEFGAEPSAQVVQHPRDLIALYRRPDFCSEGENLIEELNDRTLSVTSHRREELGQ